MTIFEELCAAIAQQQKGKENTDVFCAGEQIKDICRGHEDWCEIVLTDLQHAGMALEKAVLGIRDYAKQHKNGNCGFCGPDQAEKILRKFYGLPAPGEAPEPKTAKRVDLLDFI